MTTCQRVKRLHLLTITLSGSKSYLSLGEGIAKKRLISPGWSFGRELGIGMVGGRELGMGWSRREGIGFKDKAREAQYQTTGVII